MISIYIFTAAQQMFTWTQAMSACRQTWYLAQADLLLVVVARGAAARQYDPCTSHCLLASEQLLVRHAARP
jgi:hypothetical protein